mgnify:CR=1 FL=1
MPTRQRRRAVAADILLTAGVAVAGLTVPVEPGGRFVVDGDRGVPAAFVAVVLAQSVPLLWWRRRPIAVLAAVNVATFAAPLLGASGSLAAVAAAFPLYALSTARTVRVSLPLALAVSVGDLVYPWVPGVPDDGLSPAQLALLSFGSNLGLWAAGRATRHRRSVRERQRRADEEQVRADERARIARDLESVIAHHLSTMMWEAGAGEPALDGQRDRAGESLLRIHHAGSQALTALHRLLGILRADGDASRSPEPTVAELPRLVAHVREAGWPVTLDVLGVPRPLPPDLDGCVYQVVQEVIGEVVRGRGPGRVGIHLAYAETALEVTVTNGDPAAGHREPPAAARLAAIRERVALFDARVEASPGPDGGWLVRACFPLS